MKTLAVTLALLPVALMAQYRGPGPMGVRGSGVRTPAPVVTSPFLTSPPSVGALGGSYLSPGFSRPLGGIAPAKTPVIRNPYSRGNRYIGPVFYVPNAFDAYATADTYALDAAAERRAASTQPVIVNQYFGSNPNDYSRSEYSSSQPSAAPMMETPATAGDPIGSPANYYLIAYKNRSIYSALAYWVEDNTLHYVTTQNTHNQASLALIDVDRTTKLNAENSVPFSLSR